MKILIKNTKVYQDGKLQTADLLIDRKRIAKIAPAIDIAADKVIDAAGACVFPGFIDLHVHLRD
ncbi:MAG: dihydroorotase, partial [Candidatus Cloacimonetes bacterium]|nr:dihydroorotase [Candidatus Cloacimonadota bacterium]